MPRVDGTLSRKQGGPLCNVQCRLPMQLRVGMPWNRSESRPSRRCLHRRCLWLIKLPATKRPRTPTGRLESLHPSGLYRKLTIRSRSTLVSASPTILTRVMQASRRIHQTLHRCPALRFRQRRGRVRYTRQLRLIARRHSLTTAHQLFLTLNQSTSISRRVSRLKLIRLSSFLSTQHHDAAPPLTS